MPSTDPATPIGSLVIERPSRAAVLEKFGVDYCCGGSRSLADASREAGVPVADVQSALDDADTANSDEPAPDWASLGLKALSNHIFETHHMFLREQLPRVTELTDKVATKHGDSHPELVELARVCAALRAELETHMMKEEQILFPLCAELDAAASMPSFHCGSVGNPIRVMQLEHTDAGDALARIRELTDDFSAPDDACPSWHAMLDALEALDADLHTHIHKENNLLFPTALAREEELATVS